MIIPHIGKYVSSDILFLDSDLFGTSKVRWSFRKSSEVSEVVPNIDFSRSVMMRASIMFAAMIF